jgi:hypothetical protein
MGQLELFNRMSNIKSASEQIQSKIARNKTELLAFSDQQSMSQKYLAEAFAIPGSYMQAPTGTIANSLKTQLLEACQIRYRIQQQISSSFGDDEATLATMPLPKYCFGVFFFCEKYGKI